MKVTNYMLLSYFKEFNRKYFGNRLDKNAIVKFAHLPGHLGVAGSKAIFRKPTRKEKQKRPNCVSVITRVPRIRISDELRDSPAVAIMTLLHEMVHVSKPNWRGHGRHFNQEMLKLAKKGAFNGWW